jgi:MFS family permease
MSDSARQKAKYTILLTAFLDILGFSIIIPQLAVYAAQFGATPETTGLLTSIYSMMGFIFTPIWGRLSDRHGRRPILLVSIFGTAIGYIAFALAHSLPMLFLARIIDGITGGNISTAQAYLSDITPPAERSKNFGLFGATFGTAFAIGPLIGSALTHLPGAWGGNFGLGMFSMTLGFINLALAAKFLPETLSPQIRAANQAKPPSPNPVSGYVKTLSIPRLNTVVLIGLLSTTAFATIQIYAVYILKEYTRPLVQSAIQRDPNGSVERARVLRGAESTTPASTASGGEGGSLALAGAGDETKPYDKSIGGDYLGPLGTASRQTLAPPEGLSWRHVEKLLVRPESARVVGNIFGVIGLLSLFIQGGLMRTLPKRVGEVPLVITGTVIMAIGLLCVALVSRILPHQVWGQYLACAILTLGNGLATPVLTSLVTQFSPEAERGEVLGVFQSTQSLGRIIGPNIAALAFSFIAAGAPFVCGALIMLIAAAMALQLRSFVGTSKTAPSAA